jgi:hypothetical protein
MKQIVFVITTMFLAASPSLTLAQSKFPRESVVSFYRFHRQHDSAFSAEEIARRKRWFSDELYRLFQYELGREAEYLKKYPTNKPFFGDGVPFEPNSDCLANGKWLPSSYSVGASKIAAGRATVAVSFYTARKVCGGFIAEYKVELIKKNGLWYISDWIDNERQRLTTTLKRKEYQ